MNEETKEVEMYYYYVNGKEVWTSNLIFAQIRSDYHGSKLYSKVVVVEE
jgi:hypothetical protein